jgi:hypothetical protein
MVSIEKKYCGGWALLLSKKGWDFQNLKSVESF